MRFEGKAAIVTGGASGLGEATVRALAAKGVKIAIFDFNKEKGALTAPIFVNKFDRQQKYCRASGFPNARTIQNLMRRRYFHTL